MEKDFSFLNYLKPVTSDEKVYEGLDPSELWLFRLGETDVRGPFRQDDVIKLISRFRHEFAPLDVCTVHEKIWKPFFDHTCFNLRELSKSLQPQSKFRKFELAADTFLCMVNGIKRGPYAQEEIKEMINSKELKPDALISADHGMTWHRAYTYPQFDRRSRENIQQHTFTMPDDAMEKTKIIVLEKIRKSQEAPDSVSAGVALLSSKNSHLKSQRLNDSKSEKINKVSFISDFFSGKNKGKGTNPLFAVVLVAALVILVFVPNESGHQGKNKDALEVLQKTGRSTSTKYEEESAPTPVKYSGEGEKYRPRRPSSVNQNEEDVENEEEMESDRENEDMDQDTQRTISSEKKKKPVKKISVSHKEEADGEYESEDESNDEEDTSSQDFELTE